MSWWRKITGLVSGLIKRPVVRDRIRTVFASSARGVGRDGRLILDRSYDSTKSGRFTHISNESSDPTPSESELTTARERSLELERNDSLAFAAIQTLTLNTVTHKIRPQSTAYGDDMRFIAPRLRPFALNESQMETFRAQIESSWLAYQHEVDATGQMPWEVWVQLVARTRPSQGGVLVHKIAKPLEGGRKFRTAYELIEMGDIGTPADLMQDDSVVNGIRYDSFGAPVEYYVKTGSTPWSKLVDYKTLPARDVYHLFRPLRPGQKQAMPDLDCTLQAVKDRKDLADATIIKAQNSASITAVMQTANPGALEQDWSTGDQEIQGLSTYETVDVNKGQITVLPRGDSITEFKSDHPSTAFEPFMAGIKGDIARGIGISYLSLTRDVRGANFSTMKGTMLQDRLTYHADRILLKGLLNWIYANHVEEAVLSGWAEARHFAERRSVYVSASWAFAPWGMVEPVKEIDAAITAIDANLASQAAWASAEGEDAEEIIDSNLRLKKYLKDNMAAMGLENEPAKKPDEEPAPDDEPEQEEEPDAEEE